MLRCQIYTRLNYKSVRENEDRANWSARSRRSSGQSIRAERLGGTSLVDLDELLLVIFVVNPHPIIRGVRDARTRSLAVLLLWWQALGLAMAWSKVDNGSRVQWIGAALSIMDD